MPNALSKKMKFSFIALVCLSLWACTSQTLLDPELLIETRSIQWGTKLAGTFSLRPNALFMASETPVLKMQISGLRIKQGELHVTADLSLTQASLNLGSQTNIWGQDGLVQRISGSSVGPISPYGSAELELALGLPANAQGQIWVELTLRDLHNQSRMTRFSVPLSIQLTG